MDFALGNLPGRLPVSVQLPPTQVQRFYTSYPSMRPPTSLNVKVKWLHLHLFQTTTTNEPSFCPHSSPRLIFSAHCSVLGDHLRRTREHPFHRGSLDMSFPVGVSFTNLILVITRKINSSKSTLCRRVITRELTQNSINKLH